MTYGSSGDRFEGNWLNGVGHGNRTYTQSSGDIYTGEYY